MSLDDRPAFPSPLARRRQSRAWLAQAHRPTHRSPGPDCPRPNSHPAAREITCSDRAHRQRQSASSNPPAKSQENHIIERRFHTVWVRLGPDGPEIQLPVCPRKRTQLGYGVMSGSCQQLTLYLHSITSSARASRVGGTGDPRTSADLGLRPSSNLGGSSTGRSEGLEPLRIGEAGWALRVAIPAKFGP